MNKKSQMGGLPTERDTPFGYASPILILGLIIFVIPYFGPIIHMNIPGWVGGIGIGIILVGIVHSVLRGMQGGA